MHIGVIGCGYVFDTYMDTFHQHRNLRIGGVTDIDRARATNLGRRYGLKVYDSTKAILADPDIGLVLNLTSIDSHYEVTKAALEAGKHVYSEKPFTTDLAQAQELLAIAKHRGLSLSGAPCNAMSNAVQTMWRALREGAVGKVRVVYAECDYNPVYLMRPETWRSRSGTPFPYIKEYEAGCTLEHGGYYLSWLAAMFGPAISLTSFSKCLVPDKTDKPMHPADAADFSVACIEFQSGVTARLTFSIVAPFDQRFRVIGDRGELSMNTYRDYECPIRLARFSGLSLQARKARWVRENSLLQWIFGVGGNSVPLLRKEAGPSLVNKWRSPVRALKAMQHGMQDKCLGVAEMAAAIEGGRAPWLTPEFLLHVTELTLAIHRSGAESRTHKLETCFEPLRPLAFADGSETFQLNLRPSLVARLAEPLLERALAAHRERRVAAGFYQ
jgi:predicted dehydrogenase